MSAKGRRRENVCACVYVCTVSGRHLLSAEASLFIFRGATLKDKVSGQVSSPGQPDANLSQALLHPQLVFPQLPIVLSNCWTTAIGSLTVSASNYAVGPNIKRDFFPPLTVRIRYKPSLWTNWPENLWDHALGYHQIRALSIKWSHCGSRVLPYMRWVSLKTLAFPELLCPECFAESEVDWDCCFIWQEEGIILRQGLSHLARTK